MAGNEARAWALGGPSALKALKHHEEVVCVLYRTSTASLSTGSRLPHLRRQRRAVRVRVLTRGREVDVFEVSRPDTLRAALRPVYEYLPGGNAEVEFTGVEEEWLPLGIHRVRREAELGGPDDALRFLAA